MAKGIKASSTEDDWEAESDARTLTTAQEIRDDKKRHGKAMAKLKKQASSATKAMRREGLNIGHTNRGR